MPRCLLLLILIERLPEICPVDWSHLKNAFKAALVLATEPGVRLFPSGRNCVRSELMNRSNSPEAISSGSISSPMNRVSLPSSRWYESMVFFEQCMIQERA